MEDVFLRVSPEKAGPGDHDDLETNGAASNGQLKLRDEKNGTATNANVYGAVHELKSNPARSYNRLTGFDLWVGQMRGLLTKRAIYTLRRWLLYGAIVRYCIYFIMIYDDSRKIAEEKNLKGNLISVHHTASVRYFVPDSEPGVFESV